MQLESCTYQGNCRQVCYLHALASLQSTKFFHDWESNRDWSSAQLVRACRNCLVKVGQQQSSYSISSQCLWPHSCFQGMVILSSLWTWSWWCSGLALLSLCCLPQAFMPLLAKGAKDGNTPRYGSLASTELPVLMPVRCTLALTSL